MNIKLQLIIAFLICLAVPACSAAVIVDEDLVWTESSSELVVGGGIEQYITSPTEIESASVMDLGWGLVYQVGNTDVDLSVYDRCSFTYMGTTWEMPFDWEVGPLYPLDAYVTIPAGTFDNGNADWRYTEALDNGQIVAAFGNCRLVGYENIPLTLYANGTEITQHVTVTEPLPLGGTYFTLERNGVSSLAEYYSGGELLRTDESDSDWGPVLAGPMYQSMRLDVTINGETQSVSWGAVEPTPTPTLTPTPTPTIPTNISNVTPLDFDEPWDWPDPPIPDLGDLRLPDHIPGLDWLESLKNDAKNLSSSSFPLYNETYFAFTDIIDTYSDIVVEIVSGFIQTLFAPIYSLISLLIVFLTKLTSMLASFAPFIYVPGMFLGALFRLLPPFLVNTAALLILLDGLFMFLRWAIPELDRQVKE